MQIESLSFKMQGKDLDQILAVLPSGQRDSAPIEKNVFVANLEGFLSAFGRTRH